MSSPPVLVGIVLSFFVTVVVVVVVWQMFATWRARAVLAREEEYRRLAERSLAAQEEAGRRLGEIAERLAEADGRLASLERMLRTVE